MDTTNLEKRHGELVERMIADGYDRASLFYIKKCIEFLLTDDGVKEMSDYETAFLAFAESRCYTDDRHAYRASKCAMGRIKAFDLDGRFPCKGERSLMFLPLRPNAYSQLFGSFKKIVDDYWTTMSTSSKAPKTVNSEVCEASQFFLHCQKLGAADIWDISEPMMRSFFFDGDTIVHGKDCWYLIMNVLKTTDRFEWFRLNMPSPKRRRKNIDFLKKDEILRLSGVLNDPDSALSPLDRAVGATLFHLGIRGMDIARLTFSNIDWKKKELRLVQSKTGRPLVLPLLPAVGNAILEYLKTQRGKGGATVFLTQAAPSRALRSLGAIVNRIFDAAEIRTDGGQRGVRLFRHHLATYLITHGVEGQTVSKILGHDSPESLEAYVDLDLEGLRSCALSIEAFLKSVEDASAVPPPCASGGTALRSSLAGQMEIFIKEAGYKSERCLLLFDRFCAEHYPHAIVLSTEMMQSWCLKLSGESEASRKRRTASARVFASFSNASGWSKIPARLLAATPPSSGDTAATGRLSNTPPRRPYKSLLAPQLSEYEEFRRANGQWSNSYSSFLHTFDNYCLTNFPLEDALSEEMLEWCKVRPTECRDSCCARSYPVWSFADYSNRRNWTDVAVNRLPTGQRRDRKPHYFTDAEIVGVLDGCVDYFAGYKRRGGYNAKCLDRLQFPVFILLLLSSGIRTCEARWLHVEDVKLDEGYIDIRRSKQADEHRVPLSSSMSELLRRYDEEMANLMPGRTVFFPQDGDAYHNRKWLSKHFRCIWSRISKEDARPYDLRNTFATRNISSWAGDGKTLEERIFKLSRAMGHASIESTYGYLTPSDLLEDKIRVPRPEENHPRTPVISDQEIS